ncbi:MAG: tRNA pseudouridine(38-40) synthase TruA [Aquificaceae bacterium]|jgi:tRNA pseudouridine38-40 synthase|uniref:tRNA pseudouridine(38-40) synthase TruA n=1 Tax=Hydrogenobacter sp. Uz 6-8 TaxID=3384828 RepID=UPI0030976FA5
MPNYVLLLSFVGTRFHGWQVQPDLRTVQGVLKEGVERIFQQTVKVTGCCRTDAGVHALEYVANFQAERFIEPETLLKALNSLLPEDMGLRKVWIQEGFNARYGVKGKIYLYRILNTHARDPFLEPFCWRIPHRLDYDRMLSAVELFIGRHDFSSFAKLDEEEKNTLIEIEELSLRKVDELIEFRVRAKSFLRYMVRRMVGSLVYMGLGKLSHEDIKNYLDGRGRCPYTAKAKGLTLERVIL